MAAESKSTLLHSKKDNFAFDFSHIFSASSSVLPTQTGLEIAWLGNFTSLSELSSQVKHELN